MLNSTKRNPWISNQDILVFSVLLCAGLATRFYYLGDAPFSGDELFTILHADERSRKLVNPLYYGLTALSFKIFGFSEWASRAPAAVLGAFAPPVLYLAFQSILGRMGGIILALITLLSAWHIDYSQFSRFYSGVFLFGGLAYYAFWRAYSDGDWRGLVWGALLTLTATAFHLTAVLIGCCIAAFALVIFIWQRHTSIISPGMLKISRIVLGLAIAAAVIMLPFLWQIISRWSDMDQPYGYGFIGVLFQLVKYIGPAVSVAAGFGLLIMLKRQPVQGVFFAIAIGVPMLALTFGATRFFVRPDYIFYSIPIWYMLAAYLCVAFYDAAVTLGFSRNAVLALLLVSMLPEAVSHYSGRLTLDYRDAISYLQEQHQQGDEILTFSGGFALYSDTEWKIRKDLPFPYHENAPWQETLADLQCQDHRIWVFAPVRRAPLATPLKDFLFDRAAVKWRATEVRYDYSVFGYELFLIPRCEGNAIRSE